MQSFSNPFKSPSTMRAWTHTRRGPPSFVLKQAEIPVPELNNSASVLVRISHAALNPGSSILMHTIPFLFRSAAAVPETDFSGEIVSVGESIPEDRKKEIQPGTAVFGSIPVPYHLRTGIGALAEYAVVDVSCVTAKPENATFAEASGLPIAGVTALQLMEHSGLKRGDKVLVNGASGGIGTFVVQMCRDVVGDSGLVVGICSGKNAEMVQELGADEVIDYSAHTPLSRLISSQHSESRFDSVIDCRGVQDLYNHSFSYLVSGKPFVSVGPAMPTYSFGGMFYSVLIMLKNAIMSFLPQVLGGVGRKYVQVAGFVDLSALEKLKKMVEDGKLKTVVNECRSMDEVLQAYEVLLSRRARGKVVIKV